MLAENAGALAQRGRRPVPYFALPDSKLERVRGESGRCGPACDDSGETNPVYGSRRPSLRSQHLRLENSYARVGGRECDGLTRASDRNATVKRARRAKISKLRR